MLEYFSYKKYKKYREAKGPEEDRKTEKKEDEGKADPQSSSQSSKSTTLRKGDSSNSQHSSSADLTKAKTVLHPEDEQFLEELLSRHSDEDEDEVPPPLPPRVYEWEYDSHSDNGGTSENEPAKEPPLKAAGNSEQGDKDKGERNGKTAKKQGRLSILFSKSKKLEDGLKPDSSVAPVEVEREKKDVSRVLTRLNLSAMNNTVVSYSKDSSELLQKFTQIFKDIVNGAPTAYDDLTKLIQDRDGSISKLFDKLPSSLKKLVTQLPEKLTNTLAPELLAAAAEVQGIATTEGGIKEGVKDSAKRLLKPNNLTDLVKKPGAIVAMLKAIVNVLKTRWPAFMGMNVIWSVALSLLLVVLWYCYKRGREERLDREKAEADGHRIEELPDDPSTPSITTS